MGTANSEKQLFIIDFGLCKRYVDRKTGQHIPRTDGKSMTGTARYASINAHQGFEQSRRDDLEAIGYMLIYLLKGSLPWQGLGGKTKADKYNAIRDSKIKTPVELLCRGIPQEFAEYLSYTKNLKFDETPDYKMLKGLFTKVAKAENFVMDNVFDWFLTKAEREALREGKKPEQAKSGAGGHYKMTFKTAKTVPQPGDDSKEEQKEEVKAPSF